MLCGCFSFTLRLVTTNRINDRGVKNTQPATQMELEKRADDLSKAGVTMLGNVGGKSMVEQMSPQFLEFVLDAYRSLRWGRS